MTFAKADEIQQLASLISIFGKFSPLVDPSKNTQCESYIGRIFVKTIREFCQISREKKL
jgi:hypothetical protein